MIRLHWSGRALERQCFVLLIASLSVSTQIKPLKKQKQVDRSSREEVTHTHLNPEGLCAPRKAEKTALTKSSSQAALPCPAEKQPKSCTARKEHQRDAGLANQWRRQYWEENYRAIILRSQKIKLPLAQCASEENQNVKSAPT